MTLSHVERRIQEIDQSMQDEVGPIAKIGTLHPI